MATATKVGRNDPCPCGSGKKYKACCGGVEQRGLTTRQWLVITAVALVAGLLAISYIRSAGSGENPTCPPGQSWSQSHGHCH
ncbi:MAG: SEC-C metal-binding domain-containing protein [Acidobacteriota bacterium]|nr:SEC-C metal-binding domain-containing protein [Acidobacteriota bacterium]